MNADIQGDFPVLAGVFPGGSKVNPGTPGASQRRFACKRDLLVAFSTMWKCLQIEL
jgi:hypothetical protein